MIAALMAAGLAHAGAAGYPVKRIGPGLSVVLGPVNGVLLEHGGKTLAVYGDPRRKPAQPALVLFTHHRRDVVWAGRALVERGAEAIVPAREEQLFTGVRQFWERFEKGRFHDYAQQSTKVLADPFKAVKTIRGGERVAWEDADIQALDTPGYTRGAVSYLIETDGRRIACTGDLIYGDGKILDLYSLQDAIPETMEDGYHGYGARAADVIASLRRIAAWKPDLLIPARGPVIENPPRAIERLIGNLEAVFASHFAIDALRWYRGDEKLRIQAGRVLGAARLDWMPVAATVSDRLPDWMVAIGNSRLIVSASGAAFLIDCGNRKILDELTRLRQAGRFNKLDGIFVTHYHDDHTNMVEAAASAFGCPVYACAEMKDILERPGAYRLPALTANPLRAVSVVKEGEKRRWNEFEFTFSFFPGQTLYHGALLANKDAGETVFFIGDTFTPSGIDDYCLLNRNFLPPEKGFLDCLEAVRKLGPDHLLVNQHVPPPFRFAASQIDFVIDNLRQRARLLGGLFPWDDANYGLDEQWARFYPYGLEVQAGRRFELKVAILNHSGARRRYRVTPHLPAGWQGPRGPLATAIGPRQEGFVAIPITVPADERGVRLVRADIAFDAWDLREWTEALVTVR